jgi:hypothetical protein
LLLIKICYLKKKLINFLDGSRDFVETDRTSNSSWSIYSDRDNQGSAAGFPANPETPPQRPSSLSGNNNRYVQGVMAWVTFSGVHSLATFIWEVLRLPNGFLI